MMSLQRLNAVARKEFIHVFRDWRSLFLAIAIPMVLILLFGYALDMDLKKVPTAIWDQSYTPESRELLSLFDGSPYFSLNSYHDNYRSLQAALDSGRAMIAMVIPADFTDRIQQGEQTKIQIIVDGSDANTARLALSYATGLGLIYSKNIRTQSISLLGSGGLTVPVEMVARAWYNPDLRSQNAIIPGILAVVMMIIAAMLTSITVAKEWEVGTMEQLISTPVRVPELVVGKFVPYFVIGILDVSIAVLVGRYLFGVPLRGSAGLLFLMASIFLTGGLFFGMMISIVMKTQLLANQVAMIAGFLPTMLLSGFVFAIENMPLPIQCLTYIVPARYFIALLRGIYLKGIGLEILWLDALLLAAYAGVMILLAHRKMKLVLE